MSRILAIDLGKLMSVTCLLDTTTTETEFWTMSTERPYLKAVLKRYKPDLVVIESCTIAGWVHDVCTSKGHQVLICNPNQEAWKWKHIKRKTDRDDALKIAELAALDQLIPVYMPSERQREYRRLVKYRRRRRVAAGLLPEGRGSPPCVPAEDPRRERSLLPLLPDKLPYYGPAHRETRS